MKYQKERQWSLYGIQNVLDVFEQKRYFYLAFGYLKELRKVIEGQRKEEDGDGYVFNPIGFARSCYVHCQGVPRQPGLVPNARSRIEIEEWVPPPAFDDLTQFSHIWVLFVFHMNTNLSTLHRSITEKGFTFPVIFLFLL